MNVLLPCLRQLLAVLLLWPVLAQAHQSGNSYLRMDSTAQQLDIQLDFPVRELGSLLQLPPGERSEPGREQIAALQPALATLIRQSLQLEADGTPVKFAFVAQEVVLHNDGLYVRQRHAGPPLAGTASQLLVNYGFFNDQEKLARAFVRLQSNQRETSAVFDPRHAVQRLALREVALAELLWTYAREGMHHIWSGPDHLLFLLCLLLPGLGLARDGLRPLTGYALVVITAFTAAHSLSLAAAALDWVVLPDVLVEATIAASILVSALLNLFSGQRSHQWKLAFGFGLVHGLGFANGLRELGLSSSHFVETLLAFNLGVEAGQLLVVAGAGLLLWPWLARERVVSRVQRWGSAAIGVMATVWLVERLAA